MTEVEAERRRRIRLSVAAYCYEYMDTPIMSDHDFDRLSEQVDLSIITGNAKLDNFFKKHFEPASGMWVRKHPDKNGLHNIYERVWKMKIPTNLPDQTKQHKNYPPAVPNRVAHIDADFMCYQVSAETKEQLEGLKPRVPLEDMKNNALNGLDHLMRMAGATSYVAHITPNASTKGHRDDQALTQEYQGNRKGRDKPMYLEAIRAFIGELPNAVIHFDQEADDGMAQANYNDPENSVIVSKDKDLRMAPGLHYCFQDEVVIETDPFGDIWIDTSTTTKKVLGWGTKFFWAQMLMGDTADHIKGCPDTRNLKGKSTKVGPVAAYEYLENCTTDWQCFRVCAWLWSGSTYEWHDYRDGRSTTWQQHMIADMQLLWMRRNNNPDDVIEWLKEMSK